MNLTRQWLSSEQAAPMRSCLASAVIKPIRRELVKQTDVRNHQLFVAYRKIRVRNADLQQSVNSSETSVHTMPRRATINREPNYKDKRGIRRLFRWQ